MKVSFTVSLKVTNPMILVIIIFMFHFLNCYTLYLVRKYFWDDSDLDTKRIIYYMFEFIYEKILIKHKKEDGFDLTIILSDELRYFK